MPNFVYKSVHGNKDKNVLKSMEEGLTSSTLHILQTWDLRISVDRHQYYIQKSQKE